jgi:hypothetical protein
MRRKGREASALAFRVVRLRRVVVMGCILGLDRGPVERWASFAVLLAEGKQTD